METKMVQIRDVPADTVDVLKSRAAAKGLSLSEYLKREIDRIAAAPSMDEVLNRLRDSPRRNLSVSGAELVREGRDEYDRP